MPSSSYFSATLNDENIHPYFDLSYSHPTMVVVVVSSKLDYDDTICSGEWRDSDLDCFVPYPGKKYEGERFEFGTQELNKEPYVLEIKNTRYDESQNYRRNNK